MSAEHAERRPNEFRGVMSGTVRKVSEQSSELIQTVSQALDDDEQVDVDSLIAAFDLNASLSQALKQFLENQGQVVFPEGQSVQPPATDNGDRSKYEPSLPEGPKTFGELLKAKIANELLPKDKDTFLKSEIFEAAKNKGAVRKAAAAEGFMSQKVRFTREETIQILHRFFATPAGTFKKKNESFSLQEIRVSFFPTNRGLLTQLSVEIGYDWTENPTIDYQTAMELRELIQLEKVLTGEKVARKGRPGAQFGRRSVFPSTSSTESALGFPNQP